MEKKRDEDEVGEGNRKADREYRKHVGEFVEQHDVDALGRAAEREVEKDPDAYKRAEDEGKRHVAEEDPEVKR